MQANMSKFSAELERSPVTELTEKYFLLGDEYQKALDERDFKKAESLQAERNQLLAEIRKFIPDFN